MPPTILIATGNLHKAKEMRAIFAPALPGTILISLSDLDRDIPEPEETGATFEENALLKARYYAAHTGCLSVADDSGLCVESLAGVPGIRSSRWAGPDASDRDRIEKLLKSLAAAGAVSPADRRARFVCAAAAASPDGWSAFAVGSCQGVILGSARGVGGFGYDPVFLVPESGKTMAELTASEKNRVSHRARALRDLAPLAQAHLYEETSSVR